MTSSLNSLMPSAPALYTLTDEYKAYIESIVPILKTTGTIKNIVIPPESGYLYRFDLTSFLLDNSVPLEDHYLVMRMNELTSIHQIDENLNALIVPDQQLLNRLKQVYRTRI